MDTSQTEPVLEMNEAYRKLVETQAALPKPVPVDTAPSNAKLYNHYFKELPAGITHIDVYRVIQLFSVAAGPIDHAVKKLLCAGGRGRTTKNTKQDLIEARDSICRALEMMEEDEWSQKVKTENAGYLVEP